MKGKYKYSVILSALFLLLAVISVSCSKDESPNKTPISSPIGGAIDASVSSLTFRWEAEKNATQYGYRLYDANGTLVSGGVTKETTLVFTKLKDDSEYKLEIIAFAAAASNEYTTAQPVVLAGRTKKIVPLNAPQLCVDVTGLRVTVTWEEVENADVYTVRVLSNGEVVKETETTSTSYTFTGEQKSEYSVEVNADTEDEAYSVSAWSRIDGIKTEEEAKPIWTVEGDFYDAGEYLQTNKRTLIAYSDGSYVIKDWLFTDSGCDLQFSVNADGTITVLNSISESGGYVGVYYYPGGYYTYLYPAYSSFDAVNGSFYVYAYGGGGSGYSTFTYDPEKIVKAPKYSALAQTLEKSGWGQAFPTLTNVKVDVYEDYVLIHAFGGVEGYDLKVGVDTETTTITGVTPITNGVEGDTATSGYVTLETGRTDDAATLKPYLASGYCYGSLGDTEGYVLLGAYIGTTWGHYYIKW
ncbi:MAG: hypothetical protein HUK08_06055 [Bacteroidaceae bacterium]|nr:hypothetical protein [Bacteroidaceae bacterium]